MTSPYGERALDVAVAEALDLGVWRLVPGTTDQFYYHYPSDLADGGVPPPEWFRLPSGSGRAAGTLTARWDFYLPHFKSNPGDAFQLLAEMQRRGFNWRLEGGADTGGSFACTLGFNAIPRPEDYKTGDTLGEAICRAVIAALGGKT